MKKRFPALALALALLLAVPAQAAQDTAGNFVRSRTYTGQFSDLTEDSAFYSNVAALYEYGLSVGRTDGTFGLRDDLTVGQIIIDRTRLTPARILTGYVVAGVALSALGLYQPLADWAGAGATVPLTGFGHNLAGGVREAVAESGWLGVFTGGLTAAAGGIAAAVTAGVVTALIFRPGDKR